MQLTEEQNEIIKAEGNIKINAVAGSGKTSTIIEYALARPADSKILYLAFNKSVKIDAKKKFNEKGLTNVTVHTAHSLAYQNVIFNSKYKIRAQGYKTHEIVELLGLVGNQEKHAVYVIANHINKFISYYCNSDKAKFKELNYLDIVSDKKAKIFVTTFYDYIESNSEILYNKMATSEIEVTHDFYLKKFQLTNPKLHFDYILFDEGQDASLAMLDIFLNQKAIKVIVGDTHQQIYGWRNAVNSLEKVNFKTFNLSKSFRFNQITANLAIEILKWKNHVEEQNSFSIFGSGISDETVVKAVIARTNLGLLLKAIEYVTEKRKVKHIYFEGNINSYTYADDGASLYDVLNLYNNKRHLIRDKLIKEMKNINELEEYIQKTEDVQLAMMVEIVKEYGNKIPDILKEIKEIHVGDDNKDKAEMIFSTVHRSKGMEYDAVQIVNDFITEEKLQKIIADHKKDIINSKLIEEINLLYVAITRSKNKVYIPETLMPKNFPNSSQIHILKVEDKKEKNGTVNMQYIVDIEEDKYDKAYSVEKTREKHTDAYMPWSEELDFELEEMYNQGISTKILAVHFGRTTGAIQSRIKKIIT